MPEIASDKKTTGPAADTTRVIKRYANRKLYDTHDSRYVTLDQISELIRQGEEVKVIDNGTKDDLTSVTLAQIVFEEEKRQRSFLPLSALRKVIQSGGESLHEIVSQIHESAERVGRRFRRDEGSEASVVDDQQLLAMEASGENRELDRARTEPSRMIRDFVDGIYSHIDDWQRRVDANVHHAWETVSPLAPLQKEIQALRERILELETRLVPLNHPDDESAETRD